MKCEKCGEHDATVHISKNVNGKQTELHICNECANKMNALDDVSIIDAAGFLSSFFTPFVTKKTINKAVCPKCGTSLVDFSNSGYFGCSNCYEQFKDELQPIIRRMHGKTRHIGKIPKGLEKSLSVSKEYDILSNMLKEAIEEERYEDAAEIRDKIKKLSDSIN